ncbi:MAG: Uma2 family endonuclease [Oscillatoriophycideae cyanobacterium NC_groundwater_1537_Pr4_S-0.65um_50_18]|nr:Uma2 family endonuclease [Oscillatoriophycideae cyanobacterium NC_groundwater_1537_Pr4_S-0.65um_50_18]
MSTSFNLALYTYLEHHPYPENIFWLIEFSDSSLTKDLEDKAKVYAEADIQEYWVVNLRKMQLIVFRLPEDSAYTSKQTLTSGLISPLAFQDVEVSIDRLLGK